MNPKLPLNGHIYTLTPGRVLNTNVFQINLVKLLFRATLKVRLGSCLSLLSKCTTRTAPNQCTYKKFTTSLIEGLIHEWKHTNTVS